MQCYATSTGKVTDISKEQVPLPSLSRNLALHIQLEGCNLLQKINYLLGLHNLKSNKTSTNNTNVRTLNISIKSVNYKIICSNML